MAQNQFKVVTAGDQKTASAFNDNSAFEAVRSQRGVSRPATVWQSDVAPKRDVQRPTRAEVDLAAIANNFHVLQRVAQGRRVISVIKADAYGHGLVEVASHLEHSGSSAFGVALAEEGLALRDAGLESEILVLNGVYGRSHADVVARRLTPVVYDVSQLRAFAAVALSPLRLHVKLDTGMNRLGVPIPLLRAFLDAVHDYPQLEIAGVMTHLAAADSDPDFTEYQLRRFCNALDLVRAYGHQPESIHAYNTAGLFGSVERGIQIGDTCVRPGVGLFGLAGPWRGQTELLSTLRLRTEIVALRFVKRGESVGYDRDFKTTRDSRIATLPIGYGDGLLRAASGLAEVCVGGVRCPVVGRIAMDLCTIDVTDVPDVKLADEVVIFGDPQKGEPDLRELAVAADTLPYEVMTNLAPRVPRSYRW